MKVCRQLSLLVAAAASAGILAPTDAPAQVNLPTIIQLPTEPFVWNWGRETPERRERPDFNVTGFESVFRCSLTGSFRIGSSLRDFSSVREFEQSLSSTLHFIQDATATLNYYYRQSELRWATLDCMIPEGGEESDEKTQNRVDRALERAQRERERRRAREADDE